MIRFLDLHKKKARVLYLLLVSLLKASRIAPIV